MKDKLEKLENPSITSAFRDPKNLKNFLKQSGGISKARSFTSVRPGNMETPFGARLVFAIV